MAQMKEQNKTPDKELNEMEVTNLSDAEFKTLVIRMLKELIGYSISIKKTQAEMKKFYIKQNKEKIYRESTMEGMKPRIKSMIWNISRKKAFNHKSKKKKELKKMRIV